MFLKVKAFPDSKKEEVIEKGADKFWVYVKAPASQGLANEAVLALLAKYLGVAVKKLRLVKGSRTPSKIVEIINQEKLWK
jgi:uncharacterized protein YggU (UPF0235/DUF167 family)